MITNHQYSPAAAPISIVHASLPPACRYICRQGVVLELSIPPRLRIHMIVKHFETKVLDDCNVQLIDPYDLVLNHVAEQRASQFNLQEGERERFNLIHP